METINTNKFWKLIDKAVQASNGDNHLKERYLVHELEKLSLDEIKNFEFAFRKCIIEADEFKIMAAQKIIEGYVSDDSYLYFRCWLIGLGENVYAEILNNPDYLANIVDQKEILDWEGLMYVATDAYSKKTGKEEDETFPRDIAIDLGLDYDFGAPPTKGKDWTEDELPTMLPNLWAKLN
ncbi:DUF4240 domain-containing protein [Flammeovirga sp. SJP92]|uniref:DUF4240 domain-containing protein n=1 Tax=Flammeovirga sp. SJP92 TaxID=1775430 RepID=UPI0007897014|nr:DUF4240 domain-containing protein [Flammeovirga sp. SJP92]KXX70871.1 hypothetical protein AVL50_10890 [Flammeovirga sp. SJP92]